MSRFDNSRPPWIAPLTLKRWQEYRQEVDRDWTHRRSTLKERIQSPDGGRRTYDYMPENLSFSTHGFTEFKRYQSLDWREERRERRHGYERVETTRWTEGPYTVVVTREPLDSVDLEPYGKFTDDPSDVRRGGHWGSYFFDERVERKQFYALMKKTWHLTDAPDLVAVEAAWQAVRPRLRAFRHRCGPKKYKGNPNFQQWKCGVYDCFQGDANHRDRGRKYRYIELENFDYDELRQDYWLRGYSKFEADRLARQSFDAQVAFMQRLGNGEVSETLFEARVYDTENDPDEENPLTQESTSATLDDDYKSEQRYADAIAREVANDALYTLKKRLSKEAAKGFLPGIQ